MRTRSYRRHQQDRAKAKAVLRLKRDWCWPFPTTAREIGLNASVHGRACSCSMCGNPRKFFKQLTVQERRQFQLDKYEQNWGM